MRLRILTAWKLRLPVGVILGVLAAHGGSAAITMSISASHEVGSFPADLGAGDLDGDHDLDLVVISAALDDVTVLLNRGDGEFDPQPALPTGDNPRGLALADMDGDGDLDLLVANFGWIVSGSATDTMSLFRNRGDGTFEAGLPTTLGDGVEQIFPGDLDGDHDVDLVVNVLFSNEIAVLLNTGFNQFSITRLELDRIGGLGLGDWDGDGDLDIRATHQDRDNYAMYLRVFLNSGQGAFTPASGPELRIPTPGTQVDFDSDGDLDLVCGDYADHHLVTVERTGLASYAPPRDWGDLGLGTPDDPSLGDFDLDGNPDLAFSNVNKNALTILRNVGAGSSWEPLQFPFTGYGGWATAVGDFDGDGSPDAALAAFSSSNHGYVVIYANETPPTPDGLELR